MRAQISLAGGITHLQESTGLSATLEGGLAFGRVRMGLSPVDLTWVSSDPRPGYKRSYSIAGSILCQDVKSNEFVDESFCDDVSTRFGAMVDPSLSGFGGASGLRLGGGYRVGAERGPFLSIAWEPASGDPSGSWYLQGRIGEDFFQGAVGLSLWPR